MTAETRPHRPVTVHFHANADKLYAWSFCKLAPLPVEAPIGPCTAPPSWAGAAAAAKHAVFLAEWGPWHEAKAALDRLYTEFASVAERSVATATHLSSDWPGLRGRSPKPVRKPVLQGRRKRTPCEEHSIAEGLRLLSDCASELLARATEARGCPSTQVVYINAIGLAEDLLGS